MSSQQAPVVVVTGAGSGIGRALCVELAKLSCHLVLVGRHERPLQETATLLNTRWLAVKADVADPAQCQRTIDAAVSNFGRIDALVNNAGAVKCMPVGSHTPEVIRSVFDVNALGPAYLMAAAWRAFQTQNASDHRAGRTPRGGVIVNVSSMATVDPFPGLFAYAGAKAALNLLTKSANNEGKDLGIKCFAIAPGSVETRMLREVVDADLLPTERTLAPEAVAEVIVQCLLGAHDEKAGEVLLFPSP